MRVFTVNYILNLSNESDFLPDAFNARIIQMILCGSKQYLLFIFAVATESNSNTNSPRFVSHYVFFETNGLVSFEFCISSAVLVLLALSERTALPEMGENCS